MDISTAEQIPWEKRSFEERANELLDRTFRGKYHTNEPKIISAGYWVVNHYVGSDGLCTYDGNELTRLVIAAHDLCLRVGVSGSGPRMVKIHICRRKNRDGEFYERHPTIEQAIQKLREKPYR